MKSYTCTRIILLDKVTLANAGSLQKGDQKGHSWSEGRPKDWAVHGPDETGNVDEGYFDKTFFFFFLSVFK